MYLFKFGSLGHTKICSIHVQCSLLYKTSVKRDCRVKSDHLLRRDHLDHFFLVVGGGLIKQRTLFIYIVFLVFIWNKTMYDI